MPFQAFETADGWITVAVAGVFRGGLPLWLAAILAIAATAFLGAVLERVFHPRGGPGGEELHQRARTFTMAGRSRRPLSW